MRSIGTGRVGAPDRSTLYLDLDELLRRLNRSLRGWANYFRHGSSSRHFQQIDYHAWKQDRHLDTPKASPHLLGRGPTTLHRTRITVRLQRDHLPGRLQRQDRPVPPSRHRNDRPLDHRRRPPHRSISERDTRRAVCGDESHARFGRAACGNGLMATSAPRRRPTPRRPKGPLAPPEAAAPAASLPARRPRPREAHSERHDAQRHLARGSAELHFDPWMNASDRVPLQPTPRPRLRTGSVRRDAGQSGRRPPL